MYLCKFNQTYLSYNVMPLLKVSLLDSYKASTWLFFQVLAFHDRWELLENKGILKNSLIDHIWNKYTHLKKNLIALMEKFDLICPQYPDEDTTEVILQASTHLFLFVLLEKSDLYQFSLSQ